MHGRTHELIPKRQKSGFGHNFRKHLQSPRTQPCPNTMAFVIQVHSISINAQTHTHTHTHSHAQTQNKWYRGYGATAARLTPDQKVGNSNLSGLTLLNKYFRQSVMNDNQNHTRFAQISNPYMSGLEQHLSYVQYNYTYMYIYIYIWMGYRA